jgi:hypothetical protein
MCGLGRLNFESIALVRKIRYYHRLKYYKNKTLVNLLCVYFVDYYHTDDSIKHFYDNTHSAIVSVYNRFAETCQEVTVLICFDSHQDSEGHGLRSLEYFCIFCVLYYSPLFATDNEHLYSPFCRKENKDVHYQWRRHAFESGGKIILFPSLAEKILFFPQITQNWGFYPPVPMRAPLMCIILEIELRSLSE